MARRLSRLTFQPGFDYLWPDTREPHLRVEVLNPYINRRNLVVWLRSAWASKSIPQKISPFSTILISPLWQEVADQLLLRTPSGFPSGRVGLLGCCGALVPSDGPIGPLIAEVNGRIVWHGFANEYYFGDDERSRATAADLFDAEPFHGIGPFTFDRRQYEEAIAAALAHPLRDKAPKHL